MDNYEKKNKDAISTIKQALRQLATNGVPVGNMIEAIKDIEEKYEESEDENVLLYIINFIKVNSGINLSPDDAEKMLAWLEKHGGHAKFINGIQVGDKVTRNEDGVLVNLSQLNRVAKKQGEQNPADTEKGTNGNEREIPDSVWTEDDETTRNNISHIIRQYDKISKRNNQPCWYVGDCLLWMQNIKGRVQPQPKQEWSEEDCNQIETIACHLDNIGNGAMAESLLNIMDKYKSLRPQNAWKPSDEQIEALANALSLAKNCGEESAFDLRTLYEQLKKLMEE